MTYPTLLGHVIPYHIDGTVVKFFSTNGFLEYTLSSADMVELNDEDYTAFHSGDSYPAFYFTFFFPEEREMQGIYGIFYADQHVYRGPYNVQGSNDTTNGFDGTWETATASGGYNDGTIEFDRWRTNAKTISFSEPKKVVRVHFLNTGSGPSYGMVCVQLFGKKGLGETPDDIIFLDAEDSDAQFEIPLDYGDRPAGTTVVRQIKLQNTSEDLTANSIDIQINHTQWLISWSAGGPWASQLSISSLGPGVKSNILYMTNITPEPPANLGPYRTAMVVTVDSWT
jgi:hypothetical protein